jgi:preprotein translocase SecE subunit
MATEEDVKKKGTTESTPDAPAEDEALVRTSSKADQSIDKASEPKADDTDEGEERAESESHEEQGPAGAPSQLGYRRYVYAAYFAGAIGVAFLVSKLVGYGWTRLGQWKPSFGEPRDDVVIAISAPIGVLVAIYYWRRTRARQLAEEVAGELSKVTWPRRAEVTNWTFVVVVTTIISTIFFALMDRFWSFVTNLVYGS